MADAEKKVKNRERSLRQKAQKRRVWMEADALKAATVQDSVVETVAVKKKTRRGKRAPPIPRTKRGKMKRAAWRPVIVKPKEIEWTAMDLKRLQVALRAVKPAWEDEEAWSKIARSFSLVRSGSLHFEKIRQKAQDAFGYDIRLQNDAEQNLIRQRAAAERQLSGKRRVAGSKAAIAEQRRLMDSMTRSASAKASRDAFDASVLPTLKASGLQSLAELNESDLSDALTPVASPSQWREEKRFLPPRPSESASTLASASSDPDKPSSSNRRVYAAQRRHHHRRHPGTKAVLKNTVPQPPPPSRREAEDAARKVEERLRAARNVEASSDSSDYEEDE